MWDANSIMTSLECDDDIIMLIVWPDLVSFYIHLTEFTLNTFFGFNELGRLGNEVLDGKTSPNPVPAQFTMFHSYLSGI